MDDSLGGRREAAARLRSRLPAAAELGANVSPQDGEIIEAHTARESQPGPGRPSAAGGRMERRNSLTPQGIYQRHMPMAPDKFHIPRKTKEQKCELVPFIHAHQSYYHIEIKTNVQHYALIYKTTTINSTSEAFNVRW